MSNIEDLLEALFHVGVMAVSYEVAQDARKSFARGAENDDLWGMLFAAIASGGSAYAFGWSSKNLSRLIAKQPALRAEGGFSLRKVTLDG